jgi:hypothetical protein
VNLHDWIDELCDVLDLETEVDEGLLNDLAELTHDNVDPHAGPVTAYLLGYAAGSRTAGPATIERLAGKAQQLAESWDRPAAAPDPDDVDDPIPDDLPIDLPVDLDLDDTETDTDDTATEART